jgi:hypothetical protein
MKLQRKSFIGTDHLDEWLAANEFDYVQVFAYGTTIQAIYTLAAPDQTPSAPVLAGQVMSTYPNEDGIAVLVPIGEDGKPVLADGSGTERWGASDWTQDPAAGLDYPGEAVGSGSERWNEGAPVFFTPQNSITPTPPTTPLVNADTGQPVVEVPAQVLDGSNEATREERPVIDLGTAVEALKDPELDEPEQAPAADPNPPVVAGEPTVFNS